MGRCLRQRAGARGYNSVMHEKLLEFRLGQFQYALPVRFVLEIYPATEITPVPGVAPHVCGVSNYRGQVLPVLDLSVRIHGIPVSHSRETCFVVVNGPEGASCLMVDSVAQVGEFEVQPLPETFVQTHLLDSSMLAGLAVVGDRTLPVLDLKDLFKPVDLTLLVKVQKRLQEKPREGIEKDT